MERTISQERREKERRRAVRRRKRRLRLYRRAALLAVLIGIAALALPQVRGKETESSDGGTEVLGEAERKQYPEKLLEALERNPELEDFVKGYLQSDGSVTGGFTAEELEKEFPLFLQWDSRWGYAPYGESNIGLSGCGPTCLSMVIYSLTQDVTATPDALAAFSMAEGYYIPNQGTKWDLMTEAPRQYGLTASQLSLDEKKMKRVLDNGGMIICSMRPGDFTTIGHFIVIYGYEKEGFRVNDPNSREKSSQLWTYDVLKGQIKNLWSYSRE